MHLYFCDINFVLLLNLIIQIAAPFRITVKDSRSINGLRIEKGITVEVAKGNNSATPTDVFETTEGMKKVANAFMMVKYGIDVVRATAISRIYGYSEDLTLDFLCKM